MVEDLVIAVGAIWVAFCFYIYFYALWCYYRD